MNRDRQITAMGFGLLVVGVGLLYAGDGVAVDAFKDTYRFLYPYDSSNLAMQLIGTGIAGVGAGIAAYGLLGWTRTSIPTESDNHK